MEFREFHNALRLLLNIDADEFFSTVHGFVGSPAELTQEQWVLWDRFQRNPHSWFITAPTEEAEKLWVYMQTRMARHPNGAPMFNPSGMMLDDQGDRSVFDDIDE